LSWGLTLFLRDPGEKTGLHNLIMERLLLRESKCFCQGGSHLRLLRNEPRIRRSGRAHPAKSLHTERRKKF
jgi:hypothetical protein